MKYDLKAMVLRLGTTRRKFIAIRNITPPSVFAGNLYRAAYKRVVDNWIAGIPRIMAQYERTYTAMVRDTAGEVASELDAVNDTSVQLIFQVQASVAAWATNFELWHRDKWQAAILAGTNVHIDTLLGAGDVRDTLDTYIRWNTALVTNVSDEIRRKIGNEVFAGLRNNDAPAKVAKRIREATGIERKRALRIASDQLNKLHASISDERRRQAGLTVWRWNHSGKLHYRPEHKARDGLLYSDVAGDDGKEAQGKTIKAVPDDRPGELPYCGCTSNGVLLL